MKLPQKGSIIAEYIWIDAHGAIRSKCRVSLCPIERPLTDMERWNPPRRIPNPHMFYYHNTLLPLTGGFYTFTFADKRSVVLRSCKGCRQIWPVAS